LDCGSLLPLFRAEGPRQLAGSHFITIGIGPLKLRLNGHFERRLAAFSWKLSTIPQSGGKPPALQNHSKTQIIALAIAS
jgi:hypothetical protein